MRPWGRCVFDQSDEGKRATQAVNEDLVARRKGPEVVLRGLTESSFRGTVAPKHMSSQFGANLQNVGYMD